MQDREPNYHEVPTMKSATVREFAMQQLPIVVGLVACGFIAAYVEYGYVPGDLRPFPLAAARVPIWHLIWMGIWTGYTMALGRPGRRHLCPSLQHVGATIL
jgi:hypothetical protein